MPRPDDLLQEIEGVILRLILVHLQLFEDHQPLMLDVVDGELGVRHDVGKNIEAELKMLSGDSCPIRSELLVGRGVDEPAHTFDCVSNLLRGRPAARALEEEVLDEMRGAGQALVLQPRAAAEHEDEAGGQALRHRSHDHPGASGEAVNSIGNGHGSRQYMGARCKAWKRGHVAVPSGRLRLPTPHLWGVIRPG